MIHDDLRLALDVGPVGAEPAGVGMYAASLARALASELLGSLALIGARPEAATLDTVPASVPRTRFGTPTYHAWLQLRADRDARRTGATLAHYTNAGAPLLARLPFVITVHDLALVRHPRFHPPARLSSVPVMLAALARARAIIVPSDFTGVELARGLMVSRRRIAVVEHAPQADDAATADPEADARVLGGLALTPASYVLAVGTIEPRKNIVRLIGAFERLASDMPELRLVITGALGWHYRPILRRIDASPLRARIVLTGYLAPSAVAALVRSSAVLCYVSIYEGYGMPVLEGMALGAPVVTSNLTSMPEAAGGAAVLVDPFDEADIERGLRDALARRDELSAAGRARAAGRTWRDVAMEHIDVYRWALRR